MSILFLIKITPKHWLYKKYLYNKKCGNRIDGCTHRLFIYYQNDNKKAIWVEADGFFAFSIQNRFCDF